MYCNDCDGRMVKSGSEYFCPVCGLVISNYLKFDTYREGTGYPVPTWKSNFKQTRKPYVWSNGRRVLLN